MTRWFRELLGCVGDVPAVAAGAHVRALRQAGSDRPFYSALGACVIAFSILNGLMFMVAAGYVSGAQEPWSLWPVGVTWALVMVCVERLILQISGTKILPLVLASLPRLALSVLIAMTVAGVAALAIYKPEINNYLTAQQAKQLQALGPQVDAIYKPRIDAAKGEVARLKANVRKVEDRIAREDMRAEQALAPDGTCAARCAYYQDLAADDRDQLAAMRTRNDGRFAGRSKQVDQLLKQRRDTLRIRREAIRQQNGLLAREHALAQIKKKDPAVSRQVLLLTLLLVALDLTALMAKVLRLVTVKDGSYEKVLAGLRAQERLVGQEYEEDAKTEEARLRDEGKATRRRNRARADGSDLFGFDGDDVVSHAADGEPIEGFSLSDFVDEMDKEPAWEARPITVPAALRRGGFIGLALLLVGAAIAVAFGATGVVLLVVAVASALGLLAYTRGFRRAPAWSLRGIFLTLVAGLFLPPLVLLLNL